jgi:hypothetical protein
MSKKSEPKQKKIKSKLVNFYNDNLKSKIKYIHLPLFALLPLLTFFLANSEQLAPTDPEILTFAIFNVFIMAIIFIISLILLRSFSKSFILSTLFITLFFLYGHLEDTLKDFAIQSIKLGSTKLILLIYTIITVAVVVFLYMADKKRIAGVNKTLAIIAVVLSISTLAQIIPKEIVQSQKNVSGQNTNRPEENASQTDKDKLPDVYYIILDSYPRNDMLEKHFKYDNSKFTNDLEKRGFYVATKSNSNYVHTFLSLPSTLHMRYLDDLPARAGENSNDNTLPLTMIENNAIVPKMKSLGYKFINVGSGWFQTDKNKNSDIQLESSSGEKSINFLGMKLKLTEFMIVYTKTTGIRTLVDKNIKTGLSNAVLDAYDNLEKIPEIDEPTFAFVHITVPHPPFLFDRTGPINSQDLELSGDAYSDKPHFLDQMIYVNNKTIETVDTVLNKSDKPPIIVLAGDHGTPTDLGHPYTWKAPSDKNYEGVKERTAILNSYYFPDKDYSSLYPSVSPVNSFRIILNEYFGGQYEILPDKSYYSTYEKIYKFYNVTDLVKSKD